MCRFQARQRVVELTMDMDDASLCNVAYAFFLFMMTTRKCFMWQVFRKEYPLRAQDFIASFIKPR